MRVTGTRPETVFSTSSRPRSQLTTSTVRVDGLAQDRGGLAVAASQRQRTILNPAHCLDAAGETRVVAQVEEEVEHLRGRSVDVDRFAPGARELPSRGARACYPAERGQLLAKGARVG